MLKVNCYFTTDYTLIFRLFINRYILAAEPVLHWRQKQRSMSVRTFLTEFLHHRSNPGYIC